MKKNFFASLICVCLVIVLCFTTSFHSNAKLTTQINQYEESRQEIYFDNISVAVADSERLILSVSSEANIFESYNATKNIEKLNTYFQNYKSIEKAIASQISKGQIFAIGYTEAPVYYIEGHAERVTKTNTSRSTETDSGLTHSHGYLSLCSAIIKTDIQNNLGEYTYYGITAGEWTENSILGGSNYPASGDDRISQITNTCMIIGDHSLDTNYYNSLTRNDEPGTEGIDYYSVPDDTNEYNQYYANYMIKDDPLGVRQLSDFILTVEYFSAPANSSRTLYGIYTHTWISMDVDITIEQSSGVNYEVPYILELTGERRFIVVPEIVTKSWILESSVTFSF